MNAVRSSDSGRVVVVKAPEGLGDRLVTLLVGTLYARASGRAIAVDWRDGLLGPPGENAFDALFRLDGVAFAALPEDGETDVAPEAWRGRLERSFNGLWREELGGAWDRRAAIARFSADLGRRDHPERVVVYWDFDQLPRVRSLLSAEERALTDDELLARQFRHHVRAATPVEREVDAWLDAAPPPRLGVHVRATHEADRQQGAVALQRYFDAIDRVEHSQGRHTILLATDNGEVEAEFRDRFDARLSTRPKWFARPWDPIHLASDDPDRAASARAAAVELMALVRCDRLVTRRDSAFSHVARLASGLSTERSVALAPDAEARTTT